MAGFVPGLCALVLLRRGFFFGHVHAAVGCDLCGVGYKLHFGMSDKMLSDVIESLTFEKERAQEKERKAMDDGAFREEFLQRGKVIGLSISIGLLMGLADDGAEG